LVTEAANTMKPTRVGGLPMTDASTRVPPRDTGPQLREALRWADSPRRLAAISALDQGLVVGDRTACFAEHLQTTELGPRLAGEWSCDDALTRCVAQRAEDATVFRFIKGGSGGRALLAVIEYEGRAPALESSTLAQRWTDDPSGCGLWRGLWRRDDALLGDALTVLRNPANNLGDVAPPTYSHHCGEDARRVAAASMTVDPLAEDWVCDGLRCSYNLGHWARGVFVFRRDPSGQPKLWIVGDDFDGEGDPDDRPLLHEAIRRAGRQSCP